MRTEELANIVVLEGVWLALIVVIIIAAFKRWKPLLYLATLGASIALFAAWNLVMALASLLIYGPASMLLWIELDPNPTLKLDGRVNLLRSLAWGCLAIGVSILILRNILHIYSYLTSY